MTTNHTPTSVAQFLAKSAQSCTHCHRRLDARETVWLELDQRTDTYHDFKNVPADRSQGWFPFGKACAAKRLRIARAALAKS